MHLENRNTFSPIGFQREGPINFDCHKKKMYIKYHDKRIFWWWNFLRQTGVLVFFNASIIMLENVIKVKDEIRAIWKINCMVVVLNSFEMFSI